MDRKLYKEERQSKILKYVNENKKISVKELSEIFDISAVTIRSDITSLDNEKLLMKIHGGAISNIYNLNNVIPSELKIKSNVQEKKVVSKIANRFVKDNSVIILDSGTTTLELARILNSEGLIIYTNDLLISMELAKKRDYILNISGGELQKNVFTLAGYETMNYFNNIKVDQLFISCDAIDFEFGISTRNKGEIGVKLSMIESAKEVILMLDHTKLNRKVIHKLGDLSLIDKLIVDKISESDKEKFKDLGIEVITK